MTDLTRRLRDYDDGPAGRGWKLCEEAADEIERLHAVMAVLTECRQERWNNGARQYVFRFDDAQDRRLSDAYRAALPNTDF